ncbi:alpha/beta fold hydrolase [Aestuariivirga litoralis]|uniref:alpha/beta fold hydrolase n=1 Tax=Aestuariivirga litoralis TaxID=2650924 RepID=UPI0018C5950A|nr:alpha/beta hydrolase [Aestuariivirga litoralis]MBG1231289.1 alpha/beta hydrolase [Aestuariivirga litoralis]
MHKFNSAGVDIAYEEWGAGPPILLIHGFASNIYVNWRDTSWVKTLTHGGYRVVAIDNRGHGESAKLYDSEQYSAPAMADDARRLMDHLQIEKAVVMGYSMGARISAFLTMQYPERVSAAIFAGLASRMITGVGGSEEIAQALEADNLAEVTDRDARGFRIFADSTKSDRKALAACIRFSRVKIKPEGLAAITCPVLVVAGEKDEVAGDVTGLTSVIPGARGVVLANRNHMNAVGDSGYKAAVIDFLKGLHKPAEM